MPLVQEGLGQGEDEKSHHSVPLYELFENDNSSCANVSAQSLQSSSQSTEGDGGRGGEGYGYGIEIPYALVPYALDGDRRPMDAPAQQPDRGLSPTGANIASFSRSHTAIPYPLREAENR